MPKKQLVAVGNNGVIMTTCNRCNSPIILNWHAEQAVKQTGVRPLCTDCMRQQPANNANRGR